MPSDLDELDVKVYVDYPQYRRNIKSSFVRAVDGTSFDTSTGVNCYFEPVTRTVMGLPVPMTPEWKTTFTGQGYTRFVKSDFTFSAPGSWGNIFFYGTDDTYLFCNSNSTPITSAPVQLNGGLTRNQPLFFSYIKQDKKSSSTKIVAKLFWAGTNFVDKDTALFFKEDGSCDVYRGYTLKSGNIVSTTASTTITGTNTKFLTEITAGNVLYTEDGRLIGTVLTVSTNTTLFLTVNAAINYTGRFHNKSLKKVGSYSRNENNYNQQAVKITHSNPGNDYNDIFIMPMRGKELIINSSFGLNFSHTFDDLNAPNDPSFNGTYYEGETSLSLPSQKFLTQEILPAGAFSIVIPNEKVAFQLAKLYFLSNWSVQSKTIYNEVSSQGNNNTSYKTNAYSTGTVETVLGSNALLGTGTSFNASLVGAKIFANTGVPLLELGIVQTVNNTTSLVFTTLNKYLINNASYVVCYKKTGTISYSYTSNIITGTGTLFNTELSVNDDLYDNDNNYIGRIQSISSNTSLTLYYNSLITGSLTSYWTNIPQIASITRNVSYEYLGPSNTTSFNDLLITVSSITDNNPTTDNDTYSRLLIKQESVSAPNDLLKNNDTSQTFYSFDETTTWLPQKTKTTSVDITNILESLSIEKNEDGYSNCFFTVRKQSLLDLGVNNPDRLSNRSIKITLKPRDTNYQEVLVFDGFLNNPDIDFIQGSNYDKYALLSFSGHCKKKVLNDIYFTKAPSYDNENLFTQIQSIINYSGILGETDFVKYDLPVIGYWTGNNRNNSNGQYNNVPMISDSVGSFIEKQRSEIAQNITFAIDNSWAFDARQNKYVQSSGFKLFDSSTIRYTEGFFTFMYLSEQNANTFGSIPLQKGYKRTFRSLKRTFEAPEANQVIVVGVDKTNNDRITSIIDDVNSQNPYINPRPVNWLGEVRTFAYFNDRLTSQNIVSKSSNALFKKISTGREIIEFTSDFLTYFDSYSNSLNLTAPSPATGTINTFTYSNGVSGTGTNFTSGLIGQKLYDSNGVLIGTVASVSSTTSLTLTSNATIALTNAVWYTTPPYIFLNQYSYYDVNDAIYFIDENNVNQGAYVIISWKVDFIKNNIPVYISGVLQNPDTINVAQATYKAVKCFPQNKKEIIEFDSVNNLFSNTINVLKNTASKIVLYFMPSGCTASLSGAPSGMTFTTTNLGIFTIVTINWTPTSLQSKSVANVTLTVNNSFGSGNTYSIPLYFKVFDTL